MLRDHLEKYWVCVQALCSVQLVLSVLSMALGTALLVLASSSDSLKWPLNSGVGIWAGFIVGVSSLLGLATTCMDHTNENNRLESVYTAHFAFGIISYITSGLLAGYNIWIFVDCQQDSNIPSYCRDKFKAKLGLAAASVTLAFSLLTLTFPLSVIYCILNNNPTKLLTPQSRGNRVHTWQQ